MHCVWKLKTLCKVPISVNMSVWQEMDLPASAEERERQKKLSDLHRFWFRCANKRRAVPAIEIQ